ncbi:hypothetical protein EV715DRAFT_194956 [Schizophyllum commune]
MPFFCGSSKRASRRRQDRLSRSKVYRRLRKGLTQCARRVAAFESSEEYATMAPWAAEAYSWDLVLQYLENTRIATPASASMYQTAPVLFTPEVISSWPASSLKRWLPTTRLDDIPTFPSYRRYSSVDDAAYSSDDTASVTTSSADSASASSSAASYTTARTSLVSEPVERRPPIRPLISGPRIELYLGRHPDKPLVCPSEHVLAHNDFVPETEWDDFEDWDVDDVRDIKGNPQSHECQSRREILDRLAQLPRRKPLSIQEEREASVRCVQRWLNSLTPSYVSRKSKVLVRQAVLSSENPSNHNEEELDDDQNLFAWPSPPRPLRRTVAYPEIAKVFEDCEQWILASALPCPIPESKFRRYLLDRGASSTYLRTLRAARAPVRTETQQGGATPVVQKASAAPTTRAFHSRRLRRQPGRKLPSFLAEMFEELERQEAQRRREARRAWRRRNESTERVGRMRRVSVERG